MCLTPIRINNSTRRFVRGLSRPVLTVACGRCKECIQKMQDDWFVRCFFEYKRIEGKGDCWFPTLTFAPEHLPMWTDSKHGVSFPCFSTKLIKRFRDRLRVYLTRAGYDARDIRYICCPEFGGKRGRSHWHCLIFVPFRVSPREMKQLIEKAWKYGFVGYSKRYGMRVSSDRGTHYVMKYVSKPDHWYKKYGIDRYIRALKKDIADAKGDKEPEREHYRAFKRACPRHLQSTFFGVSGLDYYLPEGLPDMQRLVDGDIDLTKCGVTPDAKKPNYSFGMPDYYARKLFFFQDEWKLYQRNDLAHEVFALRWQLTLERKREKFLPYLTSYQKFTEHVSCLSDPTEEVWQSYADLLDGRSVDDLVLYDMVYRGIDFDPNDNTWYSACDGLTRDQQLSFLRDQAFDFMIAQRSVDRVPDPEPEKYTRYVHSSTGFTFGSLDAFQGFDNLLEKIDASESSIGDACNDAYNDERARLQALKEIHGALSAYCFTN